MADVLAGEHVHLTADAIHQLAREVLPEITRATVYNTLNELVEMGEVAEVVTGPGPRRFDPNITKPHQHLHCVRCGELLDVHPSGVDALDLPEEERYGYHLKTISVTFEGLCPPCQTGPPDERSSSSPASSRGT